MSEDSTKSLAELTSDKQPRIPLDARWFQILDAKFVAKPNKNPCFELDVETNGNPIENIGGKPVDINGLKAKAWVYVTPKNAKRVIKLYKAAGISDLSNISIEAILAQPNAGMFIGKRVMFTCQTNVKQSFKEDGITPIKGSDGESVVTENFNTEELV